MTDVAIEDESSRREVREMAERWILLARSLGGPLPVTPEWGMRLAEEVLRLQGELACEQHARACVEADLAFERRARAVAEGELADMAALAKAIAKSDPSNQHAADFARIEAALLEAIEIAERARLRGVLAPGRGELTPAEVARLRELRRLVPS